MKKIRQLISFIIVIATVICMSACSNNEQPENKANLQKVTFVLDWTPNTNHTGLYVAMEKGYFADAGIEVEVVQPPEGGAEMLVASGNAQFGVSFQDSMAPALTGEDALPITAVAAVIQHNTSGIVSRKGEGMSTPKGLEGKKYATWDSPVEKATIDWVMKADGGDFSNVELIPSTVTDEVSALSSKSVDAIWIFYAWAGIACEVADLPIDYFAFADIDPVFDYYTPVIISSNAYLEQNPETAKAFLSALSKGYEFAAENPREAADILMNAAPELKANSELVYKSQEYLAEQYLTEGKRWGEFEPERWAGFYNWLNENELLENAIDPKKGFSNDYLPEG